MAEDLTTQYTNVCASIAVLEEQRAALDVRINALTTDRQALDDDYAQRCKALSDERLKLRQEREVASRQIENFKKTRDSLGNEQKVQDHVAAAEAARVAAEKHSADLASKNAEADELLAKLRAQLAETSKPTEAAESVKTAE